jgi:antitoxin HicB
MRFRMHEFDYPLSIRRVERGYSVRSLDFPERSGIAPTLKAATDRGRAYVIEGIAGRIAARKDIPYASAAERRPTVTLPTLTIAKIALYRAMREQKVSQSELARRLGCDPKQIRRLIDPANSSRQEQLDAALEAVGRRLVITIAEAVSQPREPRRATRKIIKRNASQPPA